MSEEKKSTGRMPKLWEALVTLGILVLALAVGIIHYGVDPHVPMFVGVCAAALMAMRLGYKWGEIEKFMLDGIYKALQSCCILIIVGILIGVWINAGVVPSMIYYGLKVLHPAIFFIATVIICSITSLATGTSWGTMGTMGVALMGIGFGLGMNPAMTAGAILSGAYFGDKMSPLSDTTNLAPAMAGTDVMSHVKAMLVPTVVVYGIVLAIFGVLGATQYHGGSADMSRVTEFADALSSMFTINPLLLLPPVIVIVAVAMKIPAIPGITLGIVAGAVLGVIFQSNCDLGTIFDYGINGFYFSDEILGELSAALSSDTYDTMTTLLHETGGIMGMMFSVSMTIIAMMFGGIMEDTHQLEVVVDKLKKLARTPASLVALTEVTCVISNVHNARAVHLHRGPRPDVRRGVPQDGPAPHGALRRPGGRRHRDLRADSVEYLRRVYRHHPGHQRRPVRPLRLLQLDDASGHHPLRLHGLYAEGSEQQALQEGQEGRCGAVRQSNQAFLNQKGTGTRYVPVPFCLYTL